MRQSLEELDGVFTYVCVTKDALGVAKDEMAAKPLVLYEADDLVALASEEIAIRAIIRSMLRIMASAITCQGYNVKLGVLAP